MTATTTSIGNLFLEDATLTFRRQKELAERALAQADDSDFFRAIDPESNSLAVLVKHIGGNLRSRWTDFLTTDGEKPDRDRDREFAAEGATRASIMAVWDHGWRALFDALAALPSTDLTTVVRIRGEAMPALAAVHRSLAHVAQHVGQIVLLAKHLRSADWKTLSIARGQSQKFWAPAPPAADR